MDDKEARMRYLIASDLRLMPEYAGFLKASGLKDEECAGLSDDEAIGFSRQHLDVNVEIVGRGEVEKLCGKAWDGMTRGVCSESGQYFITCFVERMEVDGHDVPIPVYLHELGHAVEMIETLSECCSENGMERVNRGLYGITCGRTVRELGKWILLNSDDSRLPTHEAVKCAREVVATLNGIWFGWHIGVIPTMLSVDIAVACTKNELEGFVFKNLLKSLSGAIKRRTWFQKLFDEGLVIDSKSLSRALDNTTHQFLCRALYSKRVLAKFPSVRGTRKIGVV